jgi:Cu-Zn family superoxide dismutase
MTKKLRKEKALVVLGVLGMLGGALLSLGPATAADSGAVAEVRIANGSSVGKVRFNTTDEGKVLVRVSVRDLAPGFHGFHVHSTGVCNPTAMDTSGATVPFFTAGGHYNPASSPSHGAHAGDMPPLLVNADGTAVTRFETDRFSLASLLSGDGSAVILHAGPDNLAHIPGTTATGAERYHSHSETATGYLLGPDTATKATGDAGPRSGCGIVTGSSE